MGLSGGSDRTEQGDRRSPLGYETRLPGQVRGYRSALNPLATT